MTKHSWPKEYLTDNKFYSISNNVLIKEELWNNIVDTIQFKFEIVNSIIATENKPTQFLNFKRMEDFHYNTLTKFEEAINEYLKEKKEKPYLKDISKDSLKYFLYLLPIFDRYNPSISIDSDTGYINSTFNTRDKGIFTALTTEKMEIHYSSVSQDTKIYKFSGIAKIKDNSALKHFEKVFGLL